MNFVYNCFNNKFEYKVYGKLLKIFQKRQYGSDYL